MPFLSNHPTIYMKSLSRFVNIFISLIIKRLANIHRTAYLHARKGKLFQDKPVSLR